MAWLWRALWACGVLALGGCATGSHVVLDTLQAAWAGDAQAASSVQAAQLNPAYRYLRVSANQAAPALMVLGYVDATPGQDTEVWYSAQSEVIKLKGGRIVGTYGLPTDWRAVRFAQGLPPLAPGHYSRSTDTEPGSRYGEHSSLELRPLAAAPLGARLVGWTPEQAAQLAWLEERALPSWQGADVAKEGDAVEAAEATAWFALQGAPGQQRLVYSRQCLQPGYCLHMQPWPVEGGAP